MHLAWVVSRSPLLFILLILSSLVALKVQGDRFVTRAGYSSPQVRAAALQRADSAEVKVAQQIESVRPIESRVLDQAEALLEVEALDDGVGAGVGLPGRQPASSAERDGHTRQPLLIEAL